MTSLIVFALLQDLSAGAMLAIISTCLISVVETGGNVPERDAEEALSH